MFSTFSYVIFGVVRPITQGLMVLQSPASRPAFLPFLQVRKPQNSNSNNIFLV